MLKTQRDIVYIGTGVLRPPHHMNGPSKLLSLCLLRKAKALKPNHQRMKQLRVRTVSEDPQRVCRLSLWEHIGGDAIKYPCRGTAQRLSVTPAAGWAVRGVPAARTPPRACSKPQSRPASAGVRMGISPSGATLGVLVRARRPSLRPVWEPRLPKLKHVSRRCGVTSATQKPVQISFGASRAARDDAIQNPRGGRTCVSRPPASALAVSR
jgi:hypothetical protein